jgi:hypothetical protein
MSRAKARMPGTIILPGFDCLVVFAPWEDSQGEQGWRCLAFARCLKII